jgi:hypothetical protein
VLLRIFRKGRSQSEVLADVEVEIFDFAFFFYIWFLFSFFIWRSHYLIIFIENIKRVGSDRRSGLTENFKVRVCTLYRRLFSNRLSVARIKISNFAHAMCKFGY